MSAILILVALLANSEPEWPWRDMDDPSGKSYCAQGKVEIVVDKTVQCVRVGDLKDPK